VQGDGSGNDNITAEQEMIGTVEMEDVIYSSAVKVKIQLQTIMQQKEI